MLTFTKVDLVCVDQQNLKERSCQVKKIADIYSEAAKVLVGVLAKLEYRLAKVEY